MGIHKKNLEKLKEVEKPIIKTQKQNNGKINKNN